MITGFVKVAHEILAIKMQSRRSCFVDCEDNVVSSENLCTQFFKEFMTAARLADLKKMQRHTEFEEFTATLQTEYKKYVERLHANFPY